MLMRICNVANVPIATNPARDKLLLNVFKEMLIIVFRGNIIKY
jgi:methylglyoxal synthase